MTTSKLEATGLNVHKKIKHMVKSYGTMVTGIPAETLGQNAAGISLDSVKKTGNIKENIQEVVLRSEMTEPTNSCGQASNEVCDLLLGIESASEFEKANYLILSDEGINLKDSLTDKNSLIRVEIDRYNPPTTYKVINRNEFNLERAEKNQVYLLEDQLLYLTESGKVIDLEQSPELCKELFDTLINTPFYSYYPLDDGYMEASDGSEEAAICTINELFVTKSENLDCWRATHSFTILVPQAEESTLRTLYPYQAYWGTHTLQSWYSGDKDETLSKLGIEGYIEKLALIGATTDTVVRSNTYAELFSPPGKEQTFCTNLNVKVKPLRVKFKVTEVRPEIALENLESVQAFIDNTFPADTVESQCSLYKIKAQSAMADHLEVLLIPDMGKQESVTPIQVGKSQFSFFNKTSIINQSVTSSINKENISKEENEPLIELSKTLSPQIVDDNKQESDIAEITMNI